MLSKTCAFSWKQSVSADSSRTEDSNILSFSKIKNYLAYLSAE